MSDSSDEEEYLESSSLVRPYMILKGRGVKSDLPIETMVRSTDVNGDDLHDEAAEIFERAADEALAIAELSAHLKVPVAVCRLVVVDLLESNHLVKFDTAGNDASADAAIVNRILNALSPAGGAK